MAEVRNDEAPANNSAAKEEAPAIDYSDFTAALVGQEIVTYSYSQIGRDDEVRLSFTMAKTYEPVFFGEKAQDADKHLLGRVPISYFHGFLRASEAAIFKEKVLEIEPRRKDDQEVPFEPVEQEYVPYYKMFMSHDLWLVSKRDVFKAMFERYRDAITSTLDGKKRRPESQSNLLKFLVTHWRFILPRGAELACDSPDPVNCLVTLLCDHMGLFNNPAADWLQNNSDALFELLGVVRDRLVANDSKAGIEVWTDFLLGYCRHVSGQESIDAVLLNPNAEVERFTGLVRLQHMDLNSPNSVMAMKLCMPQLGNIQMLLSTYVEMVDKMRQQEHELGELRGKQMAEGATQAVTGTWTEVAFDSSNLLECGECKDVVITGNAYGEYAEMLSSKMITNRDNRCYWSTDQAMSYIQFDFASKRVALSGYSIAWSPQQGGGPRMTEWMLSGKNAANDGWTDFYHSKDESLEIALGGGSVTGKVSTQAEPFQYIKLTQVGMNAGGTYHLSIGNIQLMGRVYELQK